jgi:hypothetical protein
MPDYSKGKIYSIRSFQTDDIYIGSTTQTLAQRLGKHRTKYKLYLKGKYHYVTSFELLKYDDYYIELITLYPCSCKAELEAEEGHYIRDWDCVNKTIPGRTQKQYYIDNRDKKLEYHKQRYINNREQINEQNKQYRIDNREKINEQKKQKITCICSCNITKDNIRRHQKSKKHKKLMSEFIQNFISH